MFADMTDDDIGHRLGVNRQTIARWRDNGLSLTVGDRIAVSLGLHPVLIWQDDYWKATL
jgi:DNA-binding XRE family transcriptional regulator